MPPPPIVDGPSMVPVGETARINCTSTIMSSLSLNWYRLILNPGSSEPDLTLISGRATMVGSDLIFNSPTVMDTGTYACQLGASIRTEHTITFIGPDQGE